MVSHLYDLHPGCGITPQTPELYKAVRKSLELRGDEGTGWSLAWKVLMWARMEDGAHVEKIMKNLFYVVGSNRRNGNTKRWHLSQFILCPPTVPD